MGPDGLIVGIFLAAVALRLYREVRTGISFRRDIQERFVNQSRINLLIAALDTVITLIILFFIAIGAIILGYSVILAVGTLICIIPMWYVELKEPQVSAFSYKMLRLATLFLHIYMCYLALVILGVLPKHPPF